MLQRAKLEKMTKEEFLYNKERLRTVAEAMKSGERLSVSASLSR